LYQSLPKGLPAQVLLFDTRVDRPQRENLAAGHWDKVEAMDESLRQWVAGMQEPKQRQKQDYRALLKKVARP
jgi:hypothetical protein